MRDLTALQDVLDRAHVDPSVHTLRPDHRALLLAVDGLEPGPSDERSERLLQQAEASARRALADRAVEELPHVAAWREAYRTFGAKPQRSVFVLDALAPLDVADLQAAADDLVTRLCRPGPDVQVAQRAQPATSALGAPGSAVRPWTPALGAMLSVDLGSALSAPLIGQVGCRRHRPRRPPPRRRTARRSAADHDRHDPRTALTPLTPQEST